MEKISVIIVAAGSGVRMGGRIPKQFLPLCGKPVLVHTVTKFRKALPEAEIIVVLPQASISYWEEISAKHGLGGTYRVCAGGDNRFESVRNGLALAAGSDYIAVHDGVRPLVSERLISATLSAAREHAAAVPAVEPSDSFRVVEPDGTSNVIDRRILRAVQTPQVFRGDILRTAYEMPYREEFTDDASVVESSGIAVHLSPGEIYNIKITHPADLFFAESITEDE